MKKLLILSFTLLLSGWLAAQTIEVSGSCIATPVTLTQGTNPAFIDGKIYYEGVGLVNTPGAPVSAAISIFWMESEGVWVLAYDGQPYFFSTANTSKPPGTASTSYSWETAATAPCGSATPLSVQGNVSLWVSFGSINAYVKGNNLHVNWTTEKEVNNDHFEIEASKDGEQFFAIGTAPSLAQNGDSDATLNYQWTTNARLGLAFIPYVLILLMLLLFVRRRNTIIISSVAICLLAFVQMGCKKDKEALSEADQYYIRIAQIDKDGTKTYSKVVSVNRE